MTLLPKNAKGLTLVELVVTVAILTILASLIIPSAQLITRRNKEIELRRTLRMMRTAIDDYKAAYEEAKKESKNLPNATVDESGYPEKLEDLVEGHDFGGVSKTKKKFLRKIPVDPFNPPQPGEPPEWGVVSTSDDGKDRPLQSDEKDVFDVYSKSEEKAIDGTYYKDW